MERTRPGRRRGSVVVVGLTLLGAAALMAVQQAQASTAAPRPAQTQTDDALVEEGRQLYLTGCVSCHGADGEGTDQAPTLVGVGAAAADFYLTTGRMPAAYPQGYQATRKEPAYDQAQIDALVAYVASLGDGPPIPEVDLADADRARGGVLFRANCAACHQAAANGGALSYGKNAPSLHEATPTQVVEAMRIGPGEMPVFDPRLISPEDANDIASYVEYLRDPDHPGGLPLQGFGPVTEGFVALVFGLGGTVALCVWIVGRHRRA
jgi:ubiquinol-cytochrome c reductase cytochrome c subunit